MGWASGSTIMSRIIAAAKTAIPKMQARKEFYLEIIPTFENEDWDTEDECMGKDKAFDKALKETHPDWY